MNPDHPRFLTCGNVIGERTSIVMNLEKTTAYQAEQKNEVSFPKRRVKDLGDSEIPFFPFPILRPKSSKEQS